MPKRAFLAVFAICLLTFGPQPLEAAPQAPPVDDRQLVLAEPDYALVNLPTTLRLPRHEMSFRLTHRFLANLRQNTSAETSDVPGMRTETR